MARITSDYGWFRVSDALLVGVFSDARTGTAWVLITDKRVENGEWTFPAMPNATTVGHCVNKPTPLPNRSVSITLHPSVGWWCEVGQRSNCGSASAGRPIVLPDRQAGSGVLLELSAAGGRGPTAMLEAAANASRWRFIPVRVQLFYDYYGQAGPRSDRLPQHSSPCSKMDCPPP